MSELRWNWLCAPYLACAIVMIAVAVTAALIRGDRVMRLGVCGAASTVLPWAICSALAVCVRDPETAVRLYRVGSGPVALIGPYLLLVLLGVAGQLERNRWLARIAGLIGVVMLALCWGTSLTIPGVQMLPSGIYYTTAGPLTDLQWSQLAIWMAIGMYVSRRSGTSGEKRRISRLLIALLALGGIGSIDMLTLHGVWGMYPIAWLPGLVAGVISMYLVLRTDLLRPQGFDRNVMNEMIGFTAAAVVIGMLAYLLHGAAPLAEVVVASTVWVIALGTTWAVAQQRPMRVAGSSSLEQFVSALADVDDERMIVQRLTTLWKPIHVELRRAWRAEGNVMVEITTGERWELDGEVVAWIVEHGDTMAPNDLATMRLGEIRPKLEAVVSTHGATLLVPLLDRGALLGLVEADHGDALRDDERALVAESARAAARGLMYAALSRAAAREGANEREVEVAEAMRLQAAASRDDELGRWSVAAEYRAAPKTTGAGWSAALLADGRLAVMVTEAQADGVLAALATAAVTGAFAAATNGDAPIELDDLLASLRARAAGVMGGGEPIAAFIAVLDADRQMVEWACAGHPGGYTVGPVAYDLTQFPMGSGMAPRPVTLALGSGVAEMTRGQTQLPHDSLLVVASTAVRGADEERWTTSLREQAPAGPRLATVLVDAAQKRGDLHDDFLAVVIRQRPDRSSRQVMSFPR
ncbi:hypothetical protein BH11MYX3_BH11MYX3_15050 [soil metagenome]